MEGVLEVRRRVRQGGAEESQRVAFFFFLICQQCISSTGARETLGGASAAIRPNYAAVRGGRQAAEKCVCVRNVNGA